MLNNIKISGKKQWLVTFGLLILVAALIVAVCSVNNHHVEDGNVLESIKDIKVTDAEMKEYRERIGTDMDVKKSYLILFEDEESCREFIKTHGADDDPTAAGIGIIPMMENGYYNIVGKQSLEEAFDSLNDGAYSAEPIIYSNMYCYLKRIGIESPISDVRSLKEFIQNEKYQEIRRAGD